MEEAGPRKSTPRTRIWPQGGEGKGEGKASDAEQALTGSADYLQHAAPVSANDFLTLTLTPLP